ncbi:hypothetical protein JTE90_018671 [Oedothorax gibbosus]|uniref:Transmembrane protein n=1 Tax=Oedothorax gibbosus TaxID=931172 RepID=A0AAV6V269_9ARAC|nr:hypothetical protein JTE90_018671 [Oedothorax gibbosus]
MPTKKSKQMAEISSCYETSTTQSIHSRCPQRHRQFSKSKVHQVLMPNIYKSIANLFTKMSINISISPKTTTSTNKIVDPPLLYIADSISMVISVMMMTACLIHKLVNLQFVSCTN